jgi:hypothetical protein
VINFYGSVISKFYVLKSKCCGTTVMEVQMTEKINDIVDRAIKRSLDMTFQNKNNQNKHSYNPALYPM